MNRTGRRRMPSLDLPRARVEAAFAAHGFTFAPAEQLSDRPRRPRTIGVTGDTRARLELIGPEHTVFKATLLLHHPAEETHTATVREDLIVFVRTLLTNWAEGEGWVTAQIAAPDGSGRATTRTGDWQIDLRTSGDSRLVLRATWWPE